VDIYTTWIALELYLVPRVAAQRRDPRHMVSSPWPVRASYTWPTSGVLAAPVGSSLTWRANTGY